MSGKLLNNLKLSESLELSETTTGWWLWDETCGRNIAVHEQTPLSAFVYALTCYQERLQLVEASHKKLKTQIEGFVGQFIETDADGNDTIEVGDL